MSPSELRELANTPNVFNTPRINILDSVKKIEKQTGKRLTQLSEASIIVLKLSFLPIWIEMITELKIMQVIKKGNSFQFNCAGNSFLVEIWDFDGSPAIPMPFNEFVAWNISFYAEKNGYEII